MYLIMMVSLSLHLVLENLVLCEIHRVLLLMTMDLCTCVTVLLMGKFMFFELLFTNVLCIINYTCIHDCHKLFDHVCRLSVLL